MQLPLTVFLLVITISLFSASAVPFVDIIQEADALKSKGTYTRQYGSSTGICGLQLCSEISKSAAPPQDTSVKAERGMHTETDTTTHDTSDIKEDQMTASVNAHDVTSGKSIHSDFPTIETLSVNHANQIDSKTYIIEYEITAGNKNLERVVVSVYSDIQIINAEIPDLQSNSKGIHHVIVHANDPASITAQIHGYN
jgi:hypothetical protein